MAPRKSSSALNRLTDFLNGYLPGKLATNPWVLLSLSPFMIYFGVESYFPKSNTDLAYVITVIALAHLSTSVTAVFLNYLVIRYFMVRSVVLLLLIYLLAGVMDSWVIIAGLGIPWVMPGTGLSAWSVIIFGSLVASAWLLMGHLALGLLIGNARAYIEIQASNNELIALKNSTQVELRNYRENLQGAIAERVERALEQISKRLANLSGATDSKLLLNTAANVRELAESDVRRLSHELAEASADGFELPRTKRKLTWIGFAKFGGDSSANIPWVLSVGSLQAISLALAIGDTDTTLVVAISLLIGFPVLVFVDSIRKKLVKKSPIWWQIISAPLEYLVMSLIGVQIVGYVAKDFGNLDKYLDKFMTAVPIGGMSIWFLIFLIRGFSATYAARTKQLAETSKALLDSLTSVRLELVAVRSRLAKLLHGSVQGRLASVSLALIAAASAKNTTEANNLLSQAKSQLELVKQDLSDAFTIRNDSMDFSDRLEELIAGWQGLVEIDLNLDDQIRENLQHNSVLSQKVLESMQECLTNAVRHSAANSVSFNFSLSESKLIMKARNQGAIQPSGINPGLGWRQMADAADSIEMENLTDGFEVRLGWLL